MHNKKVYNNSPFLHKKGVIACIYAICFLLFVFNFVPLIQEWAMAKRDDSIQITDVSGNNNSYWSSYTQEPTKSNGVYNIGKAEHLSWFFNNSSATKAVLIGSIDMSGHYWSGPTAVNTNKELDGNGNSIKGLKYNSVNNGLVAKSTGGTFTFKNMSVYIEATTNATGSTGAFVGEKSGGSLTISSCSVYGSISNSGTYSSRNVGGMVGKTNELTATNCFNYATISGSATSYSLGGIVGNASSSTLTLCSNSAAISGTATYIGGLVGYSGGLTMNNSRSCNTGAITNNSTNGYAGGLVGYATPTNTTISYAYNTGIINSKAYGGGLVGGASNTITFNNVYNSANVIATENIEPKATENTWNKLSLTEGYIITNGLEYTSYSPIIQNNGSSSDPEKCKYQIISTSYTTYSPTDVSIIGDASRYSKGDNVYSICPSCISDSSGLKFTYKFSLIASDTTLTTLTFELNSSSASTDTKKFTKSLNNILASQMYGTSNDPMSITIFNGKSSVYNSTGYAWDRGNLVGINYKITSDRVRFYPVFHVTYMIVKNGDNGGYNDEDFVWYKANNLSGFSMDIGSSSYKYTSAANIKTSTFGGDYYATNSEFNGGMPFFKEMYWEYA